MASKYEGRKRRDNILKFIKDYISENEYPPTIKEIGQAVGLSSPSSVHRQLMWLECEGRIKADSGKARSIRVL